MTLLSRMTSAEGVYLNSIPIYDTHEHLAPCEAAREKETDILREYLRHYMASSVISAGLSQKDFLYVRDASKPLMERWNMVEPYWEYNRHTGYGQAVDISVKKLYGYSILPVRVIRLLLSMEDDFPFMRDISLSENSGCAARPCRRARALEQNTGAGSL